MSGKVWILRRLILHYLWDSIRSQRLTGVTDAS